MRLRVFGTSARLISLDLCRALGATLLVLGLASPVSANGSLHLFDRKFLDGAGDLKVLNYQGNLTESLFVTATDFNNDRLVPFRVGQGRALLEGTPTPTCGGPIRMSVNENFLFRQDELDRKQFAVACERSNEIGHYSVTPDGLIAEAVRRLSEGLNPASLAFVEGDRLLVGNRGDNVVNEFQVAGGNFSAEFGRHPQGGSPVNIVAKTGTNEFHGSGFGFVGLRDPHGLRRFTVSRDNVGWDPTTFALDRQPVALALGDEIPGTSSPLPQTGRGQLLYAGVRSNQAGVQDQILTYRVGSAGELTPAGSTAAGIFLTDIAVTYDRLFAVTVTTGGRDEVRAYRRVGAELFLDASLEIPEAAPSFKRIAAAPSEGRVTPLFVTGYQGSWLRSFEYTRDDDPRCTSASGVYCANGNRFEVSVDWAVPSQSRSGSGVAVPVTSDTGVFWFFTSNNIELVVKVVDGRAFNNFFWVFYGALTDVAYTITVTDTATGRIRRYTNTQGHLASVAHVRAFPGGSVLTAGASPPRAASSMADAVRKESSELTRLLPLAAPQSSQVAFQVRIDWRVPSQGTSGVGHGVLLTSDTAYFWFFSPTNVEVVLKVVDGRAVNGHYWVFYGGLSDVEYTVTVTNTETGAVRTYFNPSGTLASVADVAAF